MESALAFKNKFYPAPHSPPFVKKFPFSMQSIIVYPKNPERMTFEARRFSALQIFPIQLEIICLLIYNQYGLVVQMTAYVC